MGVISIFPLPVYMKKAEGDEFNKIQEEVISACNNIEFEQRPNWNKDTHMLSKDPFNNTNFIVDQKCNHLLEFIYGSVFEYISTIMGKDAHFQYHLMESWVTKTLKGQYAQEHHHGAADISGVYYVNTNGEDGNLVYDNIHSGMCGNFVVSCLPPKQPMPLENGLLMLWPGPLKHGTLTNKTDNERMSISFNVFVGRKGFVLDNG